MTNVVSRIEVIPVTAARAAEQRRDRVVVRPLSAVPVRLGGCALLPDLLL
jgi:hypothetical protein